MNMSLRSARFIDEDFSCGKQNFRSWDYSPQVTDYRDFPITGCQMKLISLYCDTEQESNIPWTNNRYGKQQAYLLVLYKCGTERLL